MKDSVYISEEEKDDKVEIASKKPAVLILAISVILILLLNLLNTIIFY